MSHAHRLLLHCICAFLIALPWIARAAPAVQLQRAHGVFEVRAETQVAVDVATAWQVLTDYDHLAEFVPDMRTSRVLSGAGGRLLLQQQGEAKFLLFKSRIDVILEVEESPPARLRFHAVGGNMKQMHGEWRVSAADAGITLVYAAELEPGFWVPPLIGSALMRRDISRQIGGVVQEMLKRYAAARGAAASPDDRNPPGK